MKRFFSVDLCSVTVFSAAIASAIFAPFSLQAASAQTSAQLMAQTLAQPSNQPSNQQLPPLPIEFNPDNLINPGRPGGRRRGGGSRGSCQTALPLSAIAYADSRIVEELGVTRTVETVGALTGQPRPILWFYLPAPVQETAAELVIQDSREQVVFQGTLEGETDREGIVGLELENDLPVGEAYQWFLTIDCDQTERVTVNGWVQRQFVGLDAARTLLQATDRNRAALSVRYGFWQDAVTELAKLRYFNPEDESVAQDWLRLLTTLGLEDLSEAAILPCCLLTSEVPTDEIPADETPADEIPVDGSDVPMPAPVESEEPVEPEDSTEIEEEPTPDAEEETAPEEDRNPRTILQRARDRG
ncbi:MAG: DUF928 domain-containing protein [Cyanobacteria bacterium J06650_10]